MRSLWSQGHPPWVRTPQNFEGSGKVTPGVKLLGKRPGVDERRDIGFGEEPKAEGTGRKEDRKRSKGEGRWRRKSWNGTGRGGNVTDRGSETEGDRRSLSVISSPQKDQPQRRPVTALGVTRWFV